MKLLSIIMLASQLAGCTPAFADSFKLPPHKVLVRAGTWKCAIWPQIHGGHNYQVRFLCGK